MKRFHLALGVADFEQAVKEFRRQLRVEPDVVVPHTYALFRTESLNVSLRQDGAAQSPQLRHCGWEDPLVSQFSEKKDTTNLVWESFRKDHQVDEIIKFWPEAQKLFRDNKNYPQKTPVLESDRVILRPLTWDDHEAVFNNWASDNDVTVFTAWDAHRSLHDTKLFIARVLNDYDLGRPSCWGIWHRDDHVLIGTIGFSEWSEDRIGTVGYVLSKPYWNQGIMSEVLRAVLNFGFDEMRAHRIQAICDVDHGASARVMEKAGMSFEGILKGYCSANGRYHDVRMYAKVRD